eukprot:CAMPEP_0173432498 /NCGR_PEP_ID=MMETSP1357-20121228/10271_1 /TAXON_ID=77926 /ORGANISM="Hemiselmis rufescens, Strain PCC563" /LENGTH=55 /DNA_ID=CAMNT_0014397097 /DNA_START=327 /DNA_END=490 /DNA_ORIENTATION=-
MPGADAAPPSESERCVAQLRGHPSNPSHTLTLYWGPFINFVSIVVPSLGPLLRSA